MRFRIIFHCLEKYFSGEDFSRSKFSIQFLEHFVDLFGDVAFVDRISFLFFWAISVLMLG